MPCWSTTLCLATHRLPDLVPALLFHSRRPQDAQSITPPPSPPELQPKIVQLPRPPASHHNATDDIHEPNNQRPKAARLLDQTKRNGFDVELNEHAGHALLGHGVALARDGVLVRFDSVVCEKAGCGGAVGGVEGAHGFQGVCVDGRDDAEVVLELVEVVLRGRGEGDGVVEGVVHGWEVRAEGELADDVGEVECCGLVSGRCLRGNVGGQYSCDPDARQTPCSRGRAR